MPTVTITTILTLVTLSGYHRQSITDPTTIRLTITISTITTVITRDTIANGFPVIGNGILITVAGFGFPVIGDEKEKNLAKKYFSGCCKWKEKVSRRKKC